MMLSLGMYIRALRLGWRQPPERDYLLRISEMGGRWRMEFHPLGLVPSPKRLERHLCWWENDDGEWLLEHPPIKNIKAVKRPFSLIVGEDGRP